MLGLSRARLRILCYSRSNRTKCSLTAGEGARCAGWFGVLLSIVLELLCGLVVCDGWCIEWWRLANAALGVKGVEGCWGGAGASHVDTE